MNPKTLCSLFLAAAFATSVSAAGWLTDFNAAQGAARSQNKLILVNFTGSDWCGWCIKLKNEVFTKSEFDAFASQNLVLLEIDFPRKKALSAAAKKANGALADKYKVTGYPTLHVLDGDGKSLGQLGYVPGGANAFVAKLKAIGGDRFKSVTTAGNKSPQTDAEPEAAADVPAFNGAPTFPPKYYTALELKGISGPPKARLALINNQTIGAGESAKVKLGESVVKVTCLEVHDDYAVITIDGSKERRELRMRGGL
jgi:thioredoxin-related protein